MARTLAQLVREVGERMGCYFPIRLDSTGTTTTLVASNLRELFPDSVAHVNAWVYGTVYATDNYGYERRSRAWTYSTSTLTFNASGGAWPAATAQEASIPDDEPCFELWSSALKRSRFAAAVASAVGQLGLYWFREFVNESLTTAANTWRYTLPSGQNWARVTNVQIQMNEDQATYPYMDARALGLGWEPYRTTDQSGVETWYIQFQHLPPTGRALRVFGHGYMPTLSGDLDLLPLGGTWEGAALEWIYDWAMYRANQWLSMRAPAGETDKYRVKSLQMLMEERERIVAAMRPRGNQQVIVPNAGGGLHDIGYFGSLSSTAFGG